MFIFFRPLTFIRIVLSFFNAQFFIFTFFLQRGPILNRMRPNLSCDSKLILFLISHRFNGSNTVVSEFILKPQYWFARIGLPCDSKLILFLISHSFIGSNTVVSKFMLKPQYWFARIGLPCDS